jgi:hypothetical protein
MIMSEKRLGATLFPISGLPSKAFRLRVLKVAEPIPHDTYTAIRMSRWATQLWKELKQAVVPSSRQREPVFLTPDVESLVPGFNVTVEDVPDREYTITVSPETVDVDPAKADPGELQLASEMIKRAISDAFRERGNIYWRKHWNLYFRREPENWERKDDAVDAFRGIKFGVVFLNSGAPWLAADIFTTYRGKRALSEYSTEERDRDLFYHLDDRFDPDERASFLRDNGDVKIPCRYLGGTSETVESFTFLLNGERKSVLNYYKDRYRISVPPTDEAVFVRDREGGDNLAVPASRLFPLFTTDAEEVKSCSIVSRLSPEDRIKLIREFLADLKEISFGGRKITIGAQPFIASERSVFPAPVLEFGDGGSLGVNSSLPLEESYNNFRNGKLEMLYKHGPFSSQSLPDLVLLYPDSFDRNSRENLRQKLGDEIKALCGYLPRIARQISYPLGHQRSAGAGLMRAADELVKNNDGSFLPVVVLADALNGNVYDLLKRRLTSLPSQCVRERTVRRVAHDSQAVGGSRLRNLALGVLTAAGLQPWVVAKPFHYDFYMGVDVLANQVIYVFVCGKGGRNVWVQRGDQLRRRNFGEKIDRVQLAEQLKTGVREAKRLGVPLNHIIVHRDGRWWSNEDLGLNEAIAELKDEGTLSREAQVGVVEVRKSHLPVRLFTSFNGSGNAPENPMPGSYLILNEREVILTSTGQPGKWDRQGRTAATLLLRVARQPDGGALNIRHIAEDAYGMTHLNWNAPEIEISLPVTIRWSDERLREIVTNPSASDDTELEPQEVASV